MLMLTFAVFIVFSYLLTTRKIAKALLKKGVTFTQAHDTETFILFALSCAALALLLSMIPDKG